MQTLNQLTQSHLSVLILDKSSHNPIVRMPIYAELSIVEEAPSWRISGDDLDNLGAIIANSSLSGRETVGAVLRSSLAQYIEENTFRGLDEEKKRSFLRQVVNILGNEEGLFSESESEIKEIVDRAILKAMEEFEIPQSQTPTKKSIYSYPLGYLATDHVGYASFDLSRISDLTRSQNNNFAELPRNRAKQSYAFFVYPMGKEGTRFDALEQGRFTNEAVFAKLSIEQPTLTRDLKILNLPSMQKPSLIDWYFSPGSFAAHPEFLVGGDGCERLFPAQIALQEFNIRQVVRIVGQSPIPVPEGFKLAYVDDYKVTWQSLGHSLGEILYSLPLAPGESVKLAVIDWSWESTTQRTEKTSLTEEILHQTHRDRTISETVKAGLREFQHGSSFMGGIAGSAGASGSTGVYGGAVGIAGSIGGSTATSEGSRDLVADNVQRLSDSFSQASSAQREINSTVVVQARQEEKESIQTRTFTNYNHSHTLTILYYEILRHFKVEVAWVRRRPAVLVKMSQDQLTRTFTANQLLGLRYLLDPFLLDPKLKDALDAASRVALSEEKLKRETNKWSASTQTFDPGAKTFVKLIAQFTTTSNDTSEPVFVVLVLHDGRRLEFQCDDAGEEGISPEFEKPLPFPINWNQIRGVEVRLQDINSGGDWEESSILITMVTAANERMSILADGTTRTLDDDGGSTGVLTTLQPPPPTTTNVGQKPQRADFISAEDDLAVQGLLAHFQANRSYYNRILMLAADSNSIAIEFESKAWSSGQFMIDHVDSTPLETFGSYIAYPFLDANDQFAEIDVKDSKKSAEKLITLPTRGVFAEGKLGHCNISEEIDNTRFWKWEEHPIPFEAPGINPVTPITPQPQQTNTTPTAFPSSLVNIVNPSAAPDPTGLAAALTLLGTPNIFRDMSGQQEVADLLKKLSDNTISIAEASNRATEIQRKNAGSSGLRNGGSAIANSRNDSETPRLRPDQRSNSIQDMQDMQPVLEQAQKKGLITPETSRDIYESAARERLTPGESSALSEQINNVSSNITDVSMWLDLINFIAPASVISALKARNIKVQSIYDAMGDLNVDFYAVRIRKMPSQGGILMNQEQLLTHIRTNFNDFVDSGNSSFSPLEPVDGPKWLSKDPIGAVLKIDIIGPDNAAVVASEYSTNHWRFSTVETPFAQTGSHPVSGTREWGIRPSGGDYMFYTRGADRATKILETIFGELATFPGADRLWRSLQTKVADFINQNQGEADILSPYSQRHSWGAVRTLYKLSPPQQFA